MNIDLFTLFSIHAMLFIYLYLTLSKECLKKLMIQDSHNFDQGMMFTIYSWHTLR